MSNRSAAGLRRSAIVARIRLREEWSELKGPEEPAKSLKQIPEIIQKNQKPVRSASKLVAQKVKFTKPKTSSNDVLKNKNLNIMMSNVLISETSVDSGADALRGVVALVDVGLETRALALRAALMALGATVVPAWSPFVTHLVWTQGGCRDTRAKARTLGCKLVSPLWVEACAACARRVAERAFPAATRASDLPSPRALWGMLKRAEAENIPLADLLNGNNIQLDNNPNQRLRISSETDKDTSADRTDSTNETSTDRNTSHDRSSDTTDPTIRVNTLPRGGNKPSPPKHPRSRRKLFTHREGQDLTKEDEDDTPALPKRTVSKITQRERKELARAERMAKRMLGASTPAKTQTQQILSQTDAPRIVLTGMSRAERQTVNTAIKSLNGRIQKHVNHRTTHVVLGSCLPSENQNNPDTTGINRLNQTSKSIHTCAKPRPCSKVTSTLIPSTSGMESISQFARCGVEKARTLNALLGAARGCRVVYAQWIADSLEVRKWLHHHGYEVQHLTKISQKARVERNALGRTCSDYAYDVFKGMRVRVSPHSDQRDAAIQLLKLCGGVVQDGGQNGAGQNGGFQNGAGQNGCFQDGGYQNGAGHNGGFQDGGAQSADYDICVGNSDGEVSSKWVFDSVAAGRMRTTRKYVNLAGENAR